MFDLFTGRVDSLVVKDIFLVGDLVLHGEQRQGREHEGHGSMRAGEHGNMRAWEQGCMGVWEHEGMGA